MMPDAPQDHYAVVDDRQSPPPKDDPSDVLDRLKVLVWQATDDTVLWQQIVFAALDYAHARTMATIDRVCSKHFAEPMGGEGQ